MSIGEFNNLDQSPFFANKNPNFPWVFIENFYKDKQRAGALLSSNQMKHTCMGMLATKCGKANSFLQEGPF